MPSYPIFHRWNVTPIAVADAESFQRALELTVRQGISLLYADLKGIEVPRAFLPGADLRGADLSHSRLSGVYLRKGDLRAAGLHGATLTGTVLREANLRHADLREADLRHADLRDASLMGADLRGTLLTGARLTGTIFDWRWSVVPVELLRRHPGAAGNGFEVVTDLAFQDDARPFAWLDVLVRHQAQADWVLSVLAEHLHPQDNAPELLKRLAADVAPGPNSVPAGEAAEPGEGPATVKMLWTRRAGLVSPRGLRAN